MPIAELAFADPELHLSVRAFQVDDGLSQLFDVLVTATSESPDLDVEAFLGRPAAFRIHTPDAAHPHVQWSGICNEIEQVHVEESGSSIYAVRIVPMLWRATQRTNYRVFQHMTAAEIVAAVLSDWDIEVTLRLDPDAQIRHEYRVQFDESDYAFVARTLEEAGLSYLLEQVVAEKDEETDERALPPTRVVLTDQPATTASRREEPVRYVGHTEQSEDGEFVRKTRFVRSLRPGRFTLAGYDARVSPDLRLLAEVRASIEREQRYEQFQYRPPAFAEETERGGRATVKISDETAQQQAAIELQRARTAHRKVVYETNVLSLGPGKVFSLDQNPRPELTEPLLVVTRTLRGEVDDEWTVRCEAVLVQDGFRPPAITPRPRVNGIQSALVVGPEGEEVYTDELGRVKVQFFWDRYGERDEHSSCWIRVSQGWAGNGMGMVNLPRVGHEVLVDFLDGDPDRPLVIGRAYNRGAMPPATLPREKTRSTWRSATSPGGDGFNEIAMEDAQGEEELFFRAQRNLTKVVQADEQGSVGGSLTTSVRRDASHSVGGTQTVEVTADHLLTVHGRAVMAADRGLTAAVGRDVGLFCEPGRVVLTNGSASLVLDGPNLYLDAEANLRARGGRALALHGQQVDVQGRPNVFINSGDFTGPEVAVAPRSGTAALRPDERPAERPAAAALAPRDRVEPPGGADGYAFLRDLAKRNGIDLPKRLYLTPELNEQVERYGDLAAAGHRVKGKLLDEDTYNQMRERVNERIEAEKDRLQTLGRDMQATFDRQRNHYGDLHERVKARVEQEKNNLAELRTDMKEILSGERGNLLESAKALVDVAKEQAGNLKALRDDVKATIEREVAYAKRFKEEWVGHYEEVKGYVEDVKNLIDNPKDAVIDLVFGEDEQFKQDLVTIADQLGVGDEVADFFGFGGSGAEGAVGGTEAVADGATGVIRDSTADKLGDALGGGLGGGGGATGTLGQGTGSKLGGALGGSSTAPAAAGPNQAAAVKPGAVTGNNAQFPGGSKMAPGAKQLGPNAQGIQAAPVQGGQGVPGGTSLPSDVGASQNVPTNAALDGTPEISGMSGSGADGLGDGSGLSGGAGGLEGSGVADPSLLGGESVAQASSPPLDGSHLLGKEVEGAAADAAAQPSSFGPSTLAQDVSPETVSVLQSPADGQLLVVPSESAAALSPDAMSSAMVDAQMAGTGGSGGIAGALSQQGYTVYTRSWGDWYGPFVQAAQNAAV